MLFMSSSVYSMYISYYINAPCEKVYNTFINADPIAQWMVPSVMKMNIHEFGGREGGLFQISG